VTVPTGRTLSLVIVVTLSRPHLGHNWRSFSDRLERQGHAPSRDPRRCALELHPGRLAGPWLDRLALKPVPSWRSRVSAMLMLELSGGVFVRPDTGSPLRIGAGGLTGRRRVAALVTHRGARGEWLAGQIAPDLTSAWPRGATRARVRRASADGGWSCGWARGSQRAGAKDQCCRRGPKRINRWYCMQTREGPSEHPWCRQEE
jgi:hypothetical protein